MKISIVTPSFNSAHGLERAIHSVLAQGFPDVEHIVVDGGSTDGSIKILKKYAHLRWISEPDKGQVDAMRKGFAISTGDIIGNLNADDYYLEGAFDAVMAEFEAGAPFVMGDVLVKDEMHGTEWLNEPKTELGQILKHWEPQAFCVNPVGYFYRREVQDRIPFNMDNDDKQDLEFLIEAAAAFGIRKIRRTLGVFCHERKSKTTREQLDPGYWRPDNFAFVDRALETMPPDYRRRFREQREQGYQLRRHWTIRDAIAQGELKRLLESRRAFLVPDDRAPESAGHEFTDHSKVAARTDWIVLLWDAGVLEDQFFLSRLHELRSRGDLSLPVFRLNHSGLSGGTDAIDALWKCFRHELRWKHILGVGDPIAQAIETLSGSSRGLGNGVTLDAADVLRASRSILDRLRRELEVEWNLEIDSIPFDAGRGFAAIRKEGFDLLIYKRDRILDNFEVCIDEFFGLKASNAGLRWPGLRDATRNASALLGLQWDASEVDRIYDDPLITRFYSKDEIQKFKGNLGMGASPISKLFSWIRPKLDESPPVRAGATNPADEAVKTVAMAQAIRLESPGVEPLTPPVACIPSNMDHFLFSRKSHYEYLSREVAPVLYGFAVDIQKSTLKCYQDLIVLAFIQQNLRPGARMLEIGGGYSRIFTHLPGSYEKWILDKYEGVGNGPVTLPASMGQVKVVRDYIGEFSSDLPDNYFDFVFSISVLEHCPQEPEAVQRIVADVDRVLKPGGKSFHCVDAVFVDKNLGGSEFTFYFLHPLIPSMIEKGNYGNPPLEEIVNQPDFFGMSKESYDAFWKSLSKREYENFGIPFSVNIYYEKPS